MIPLLYWLAISVGLTYLARDAKILDLPRLWLVTKSRFLLRLLSCGPCTTFWTGSAVAALLLATDTLTCSWWTLPLWGIAGIGVFDVLGRLSVVKPLDRIARRLPRDGE